MNIIKDFFKYSKRRVFNYAFKFLLAFALMYIGSIILFIPKAHAQVVYSAVSVNGYEATTRNYISVPNSQWAYMIVDATNTTNSGYFKISSCYDGVITQYGIDYPALFSNPLVVQTKVPCKYYNSTYDKGTVTNFYFNYNVSSSGATSFSTTFSFLTFAATFQLLSVESSDVPFDVTSGLSDDSNYKIIDQNQTVIDQNNQIINGNKVLSEKQDQTNQELKDLNSNLNNSDTSGAKDEAGNFFSGFETDTHGLTSIITAPLNLIKSITSTSCSPLGLEVPFVENKTLNLPCMSSIYEKHFGSFLTIYQTITFGIVAYWVCVNIFRMVKDFKNPERDEIEVMDL